MSSSSSTARRPPRDPAAPKRNMSAYLLYQNAMRDTFKQQNPGMTFGQLSKYTSAMYAEMPPAEKEAWNQRAEADKARYLHELSTYVPPPGYDVKGDAIATHVTHTLPPKPRLNRGTIKTPRDPNAPKRNMSAYLLYQNCMRETFKNINPGMTFGQLAKFTSHMYKSLSADEKQRWEAHAAQDKARYEAEMASYVPPPGYDATGNLVEDRRLSKKYQKKPKDPEQPKRARGSFVFFTFDERPNVMAEFPGIKFVEMGTILGERWRALSNEEKQKYEDLAQEDKQRFNKEMEEYSANKQPEPEENVIDQRAYNQHITAYADPHAQYYEHAHYMDPQQQQHYAQIQQQHYDPNVHGGDPYAQHAYHYQQQYHYA